jgi:PAT family beta-lactamase induction signal transducer AmpG
MAVIFLLGFASGLPLLLTGGTLKLWMSREHVDISTIGYFSWVGLAYSLKFIWSPLMDRFTLGKLGRRRGWMFVTQMAIAALIFGIGTCDPKFNLNTIAPLAVLLAFFSATQDIVIDAYRREYLPTEELGLGSSINIYGYRTAMLITGGVGVSLVGTEGWGLTWNQLYFVLAACMSVGLAATFWCPEPKVDAPPPRSLTHAVIDPLREFMQRQGAVLILAFVLLFKFGDAIAGQMLNPYYVEIGFTNADIGLIAKTFGMISSLVGVFLGGVIIYYLGIFRSLLVFGIFQALSTVAFAMLTTTGPQRWALAFVVIFEDVSASMGSAAFIAYMSELTNKRYTATQYAILSSVATLGRNFFSGFSGDMVKAVGWPMFFNLCGIMAIPGLFLLLFIHRYQLNKKLEPA